MPEHSSKLMVSLFRELWQTETSAARHPLVDADRLGSAPPAQALRAVSAHATEVLRELEMLARHQNLPVSSAGMAVGGAFSHTRQKFADLLLDVERSYRGTLLGMRHGVDLVELIAATARAQQNVELASFFDRWLTTRKPLYEQCVRELQWFARNEDRALQPVARAGWARGFHKLAHAVSGVRRRSFA
jgi:hypothetical protein